MNRKIFVRTLIASVFSDLALAAGHMVDGIVIGNYAGVNAVAAFSLFTPAMFILTFIGPAIQRGAVSTYTMLIGKGEIDKANSVFTLANIFAVTVSLILTLIAVIYAEPIMQLLGAVGKNSHLVKTGADYIRGYAPGIAFFCSGRILSGFMNIDGDLNRTVYSIVIMTIVNIAGDFYAVLFTDTGMFGIGLATSIGNAVCFAVLMMHFLRKRRILSWKFEFSGIKEIAFNIINMLKKGATQANSRIVKTIAGIGISHVLTLYASGAALAAYGIHVQLRNSVGIFHIAVANTVWLMTCIAHGEENRTALHEIQNMVIRIALPIGACVSAALILFRENFAVLYLGHADPEVLAMASKSILALGCTIMLFIIMFSFSNYIDAIKRIFASNVFTVILQFMPLVSIFFMVRLWGDDGIWPALFLGGVFYLVIALVYMLTIGLDVPLFREKALMLDKNFPREDESHEIEYLADSMFDVMGMSSAAHLFCLENGFSGKKSANLALCIEEMCGNIIQYGFNDGKKHTIHMRILAKDNEIIARIRDDCKPFNPVERYEMTVQNHEDPTKNIGIRLTMKLCSSVQYLSTFGMNNLIMKISK